MVPQCDRALNDRGTVTAEFAIVLPAVLMVLALAVGAILLSTQGLTLTAAAAEVARLEARGDMDAASERLAHLNPQVGVLRTSQGTLHCVTLRSVPLGGILGLVSVTGRGCAAVAAAS